MVSALQKIMGQARAVSPGPEGQSLPRPGKEVGGATKIPVLPDDEYIRGMGGPPEFPSPGAGAYTLGPHSHPHDTAPAPPSTMEHGTPADGSSTRTPSAQTTSSRTTIPGDGSSSRARYQISASLDDLIRSTYGNAGGDVGKAPGSGKSSQRGLGKSPTRTSPYGARHFGR